MGNNTDKKEKSSELFQKYKKQIVFIIMAVFLTLIFTIINYFAGDYFTFKSYDVLVKYIGGREQKPHKDVVLIMIDENSMQYGEKLGLGNWPWPRKIYPEILDYINRADPPPKAVFFDIFFVESDRGEGNDSIFAEGIMNSGNVYQNIQFIYNSENKKMFPLPLDVIKNYSLKIESPENITFKKNRANEYEVPIPCLRSDVPCSVKDITIAESKNDKRYQKYLKLLKKSNPIVRGFSVASFEAESDGVNRKGRIIFKYGDTYFPSMTVSAVMAYSGESKVKILSGGNIQIGKYDIPVEDDGKYIVNFYKQENRVPQYSMSGLMECAYYLSQGQEDKIYTPPDTFSDKIVIIGVSAVGGQDLKNTPIHKTMPGPEIHANIISNILQSNHIKYSSNFIQLIIVFSLIILCVSAVLFISSNLLKIILLLIILSAYLASNVLLFHFYNYLIPLYLLLSAGLSSSAVSFIYLSMTEGAEKRKYSKILGNMIDPHIVNEALKDLESLKKGGEKNITAFFSDVASFSTISEKLSSVDLAALLNEYLSAMTLILKEHGGTLDKYIGDAVVGIFGAPVDNPDNAILAARASIKMIDTLAVLREKWKRENAYCPEAQQMHFRIGLNSGPAKVGFMGTENLASYTMMGDTVNLAARLEAAGKDYGVEILVSEMTRNKIKDEMFLRLIDAVRVKGKSEPVLIYELIGKTGNVPQNIVESVELYNQAFELYRQRKWGGAIIKFNESGKSRGELDKSAKLLIGRCEEYKENPPPENWDGVFTRTHK